MMHQAQQSNHQGCGKRKVPAEVGQPRGHNLERSVEGHSDKDDISKQVKTSATCTTGSLMVIEGGEGDRVPKEDDRLARHVDTEGKCASGDNDS